jgi:hypothetical protein
MLRCRKFFARVRGIACARFDPSTTDPSMTATASPANTGFFGVADGRFHFVAIGAVALVAAIFLFGYPLVISLAVLAAFVAIGLLVGLTALDLAASKTPAPRKAPVRNAAAQAA